MTREGRKTIPLFSEREQRWPKPEPEFNPQAGGCPWAQCTNEALVLIYLGRSFLDNICKGEQGNINF